MFAETTPFLAYRDRENTMSHHAAQNGDTDGGAEPDVHPDTFSVRVSVRAYEIDGNGHVNGAVYLQYAEHARWEFLRAAGIDQQAFTERGVGPVFLETVLRYRAELRYPDTVDVTCGMRWGSGRTWQVRQRLLRPGGELVAEVDSVGGLIHLTTRKLVTQPAEHYRAISRTPSVLGL
jgi:acyl-CoA thioester hydrolase